jgi:hypothetical protein
VGAFSVSFGVKRDRPAAQAVKKFLLKKYL